MNSLGTIMQWTQLIVLIVGLLTLFIQIGNKQGKQEEKNANFVKIFETHEKHLENHDGKFDKLESDISTIKTDVSFIKGKLL